MDLLSAMKDDTAMLRVQMCAVRFVSRMRMRKKERAKLRQKIKEAEALKAASAPLD